MSTTTATPTVTQNVIPYMTVAGADRAIAWYSDVFGAVEEGDRYVDADGKIGHAELRVGAMQLFIADEYPEYDVAGPDPNGPVAMGLLMYVDDVDDVYARALAAGARGDRAPEDQPYGDRSATIRDPFGHRWQISTRLADLSREEIQQRLQEAGGDFDLRQVRAVSQVVNLGYFTLPGGADTERAAAFYGTLFGWDAQLSPGGAHIANVSPPGGLEAGADAPKLYFRIERGQLETVAARVRDLGGTTDDVSESPSGRGVSCRDDQGTQFELWEPAPGY